MVESRVIQCGDEIDAFFAAQTEPKKNKPAELSVAPATREALLDVIAEQRETINRIHDDYVMACDKVYLRDNKIKKLKVNIAYLLALSFLSLGYISLKAAGVL